MEPLRIGVIGLNFGQQLVRTLANMGNFRLVAIADNAPALPGGLDAYASKYGAKPYLDGIEMLKCEKLDAVVISVSPRWRLDLIRVAAMQGVAMFVEKPCS